MMGLVLTIAGIAGLVVWRMAFSDTLVPLSAPDWERQIDACAETKALLDRIRGKAAER
jgi:hypothetical protein